MTIFIFHPEDYTEAKNSAESRQGHEVKAPRLTLIPFYIKLSLLKRWKLSVQNFLIFLRCGIANLRTKWIHFGTYAKFAKRMLNSWVLFVIRGKRNMSPPEAPQNSIYSKRNGQIGNFLSFSKSIMEMSRVILPERWITYVKNVWNNSVRDVNVHWWNGGVFLYFWHISETVTVRLLIWKRTFYTQLINSRYRFYT